MPAGSWPKSKPSSCKSERPWLLSGTRGVLFLLAVFRQPMGPETHNSSSRGPATYRYSISQPIMRAIAGSILILAAVLLHRSPATSRPVGFYLLCLIVLAGASYLVLDVAGQNCPPYFAALLTRLKRGC